jgi:MoxR-like ATPase
VGYPDRHDELNILKTHQTSRPIDTLQPVLTSEQIVEIQKAVSAIRVDNSINQYILDIVDATRKHEDLLVGVSTRGAIALSRAAQSQALLEGRNFAVPDDVKSLAVPVLSHRIVLKSILHNQRRMEESIIERILETIPVPVA